MPSSWADAAPDPETEDPTLPPVVREILLPINRQKGDELPVSAFRGREDGTMELGLTAYEKRGIAVNIPRWTAQACLQCNLCSLVCPHAAIRAFPVRCRRGRRGPRRIDCVPAKGAAGLSYTVQGLRLRLHWLRKLRCRLPCCRKGPGHDPRRLNRR